MSGRLNGKRSIKTCLPITWPARFDQLVEKLDLAVLFATYTGRGSKALWPDLLLRLVLYRHNLADSLLPNGSVDARENDPARWLLFGMKPSRTSPY